MNRFRFSMSSFLLVVSLGQIQWVDGNVLQWTPTNHIVADTPTPMVAGHAVMGGLFALLGGVLTLLFRDAEQATRSSPPNDG